MASPTESGTTNAHPANPGGFRVDSAQKSLRDRDEFYQETYRFFDTLGKHTRAVAVGTAVLIGAGVVGGIVANRREAKSESAKDALFVAEKSYETELKSIAGIQPPSTGSGQDASASKNSKDKEAADKAKREENALSAKKMEDLAYQGLDVDAKFPETVKKYRTVIDQFAGTRAAHEAQMSLGTLYYNHGQAAKAAPIFQSAADSASGNFEKSLSLQSLGYALENSGKYAEALTAYEKALNLGEAGIKGDLWLAMARCQNALHDTAKARSTYDQILSQLPNTDAARTAEALKAKLQ